jgi:UDP-GlcNAc3NAcA epimerase
MKLLTVIGARPQFIKAAAVSRAIHNWNLKYPEKRIDELIIHTGQHYDDNMSEVFFREMRIPKPHKNLQVGSGSHGEQTGQMLAQLEKEFQLQKPNAVLVYGDTNSTLAGALAASKIHIPVVHVEAGLRSYNKKMPEEQNRVLTDHLSTILFCPTETAVKNLKKEGFISFNLNIKHSPDSPAIIQCGDVMYDCVLFYGKLAEEKKSIFCKLNLIDDQNQKKPFVLSTIHRPENTDSSDKLFGILSALKEINEKIPVILPLHPRTLSFINQSSKIKELLKTLKIIKPVSYLEMILLEKYCSFICTDSGGVQKEAYFFRKPCLTMRDQTEWTETVDAGWNVIAGGDTQKIINCSRQVFDWEIKEKRTTPFKQNSDSTENLFGDGNSADQMIIWMTQVFDFARRNKT